MTGAERQVAAIETLGGVLSDLIELAERLPVPPHQTEVTARILDRLSEELTEAAAWVRGSTASSPPMSGTGPAQPI